MLIAKIFAILVLVTLTFDAGLRVQWRQIASVLRNGSLIARVVIANFILVPLIGVMLARVFQLSDEIATGLLLMAISPGVPGLVLQIEKKGGSLDTAAALVVLLPVLTVITVPLTAELLLPAKALAQLPLVPFVLKLVFLQFLPLAVGMALSQRIAPEQRERLSRAAILVFIVSLVGLLAMLFPKLVSAVTSIYGERGGLAAIALVVASFALGYAFGGPTQSDRRVLALGTMLRNVGLAATIATTSFGGGSVVAGVLTYFVVQVCGSLAVSTYWVRALRPAAPR